MAQGASDAAEAISQGISDATDSITRMIFGDKAQENDDADTGNPPIASCPTEPFVHYTDFQNMMNIVKNRIFMPGAGNGGVYFTKVYFGPYSVWQIIFIGNREHIRRGKYCVHILADCTSGINLIPTTNISLMPEYFHQGAVRERPPNIMITMFHINSYPEMPEYEGMIIP